jgi:hypothetical protein
MLEMSDKLESVQQDKENIHTDSGMSTSSKDGSSILTNPHDEKAEVLIGDQSEDGEVPPPKAQEALQVANNINGPTKISELSDSEDESLRDAEPTSERQSEQATSSVASPSGGVKTAFPSTAEMDDDADDSDAVLVSSSDLVGHDPSMDNTPGSASSRRSGGKGVDAFTKRLSFKGVSEGLRRSGSRSSDKKTNSERGSLETTDKRSSLDRVQEVKNGYQTTGDVASIQAEKSDSAPSSPAEVAAPNLINGDKLDNSTSVDKAGVVRPAFRARVSASAEGVKRVVLGARKDSAGSVKKVEGELRNACLWAKHCS